MMASAVFIESSFSTVKPRRAAIDFTDQPKSWCERPFAMFYKPLQNGNNFHQHAPYQTAAAENDVSFRRLRGRMSQADRCRIMIGFTAAVLGVATSFATEIPQASGAITIDGRLNDEGWRDAKILRLVQLEPIVGANPSERSEVMLAHDGEALYAAARFGDSEPSLIRANGLQRDELNGDDLFGLVIDSFNDDESALAFYTNPAGTRIDEAISNDGEWGGSSPFNRNWNTFWDAAAHRTPDGWEAEIRIPFSSLRFKPEDGRVVMGVLCWRSIARKSEINVYPALDGRLHHGHQRPSQAEDMQLVGVSAGRQLLVTPYVLSGVSQHTETSENTGKSVNTLADGYEVLEIQNNQAGLDLKWGITSDVTLDVTINTDFAQVEADDAVVNLSRFSIFRPEKRLFFQERAGVFEFGTGGVSRLFYSRRIGIDEDGAPVRILGGVRVVGRVGEWDIGALDMQTEANDEMPAENLGVVRVRRQAFNNGSYVGGIVTSRIDADGGSNLAYGLDSVIRFNSGDELVVRWAQTFDTEAGQPVVGGFDSGRFYTRLQRRNRDGWGYTAVGAWCGPDYLPRLGFAAREGFTQLYGELRHGRLRNGDSWYRSMNRWVDGGGYWRTEDGRLDSGHFGFGSNVQTRAGTWMWADLRGFKEDLLEGFELGDGVEVPQGSYSWVGLMGGFHLPRGRNVSLWGNGYLGQFYDGQRLRTRLGPQWTASKNLTVGLTYEFNAIRFPARNDELLIHLAQLRLVWSFSSKISTDLLTQFSSLDQAVLSNLRFRYNFREGTDLYVVLSESMWTDRFQNGLWLPRSDSRSVVVKYSQTWNL
jgi:hypothetical protein